MPVLFICKFDEDPIKNEVPTVRTTFSPLYVNGRLNGKLLNVNSPICPKIELVKDFIAVLITGKSNEESIKNKIPIIQTTFSEVYGPSRVDKSHANSRKWVKIELV